MNIIKIYWTFHDVLSAIGLCIVLLLFLVAAVVIAIQEHKKKKQGEK